jgi:hypothetical protein
MCYAPDVTGPGHGRPIHRLDADGYRFTDEGFRRVFEVSADAIEIPSGAVVRIASDEQTSWYVTGRSKDNGISLAQLTDPPTFCSVNVRTFLVANPSLLVGQMVTHAGASWRVDGHHGNVLRLSRLGDSSVLEVNAGMVVEANLNVLRDRMILLVDVG